ncbi:hypothetical protein FIBSPDRAFT_363465 [Athelia psychrophila]|uniref:Uncharacterized protein n=1 Tax=Athelia psychrophila TaxID=1759441 RepID=A0A166PF74_9AGAM|nr:hypothetical protein FIBSPDRAFT_363465 [Fibularhizoctonia sp. CBS 109695]
MLLARSFDNKRRIAKGASLVVGLLWYCFIRSARPVRGSARSVCVCVGAPYYVVPVDAETLSAELARSTPCPRGRRRRGR